MIQRVRVNLIPSYNLTLPVVHLKQYDQTDDGVGKQIELELYSGDDVYEIPSNAVVTFQGTKTDKKGYQYEVSSYEGNLVTVDIKSQMTVLSGTHEAELRITVGESIINTTRLVMDIDSAALADDTAISDTELPLIQKAVEAGEKVEELRKEIEGKQDQLVSGTNIKTINSQSLLGSGNITIEGGGSSDYNDLTNKPTLNGTELKGNVTITTVSEDAKNISANASSISNLKEEVSKKANQTELDTLSSTVKTNTKNIETNTNDIAANTANITKKQDQLVSGTNIKTVNNQSLLGSGNVDVSSNVYSTDEQVVGTWLDGKKIYRKVLAQNATILNAEYKVDVSSLNVEAILHAGGLTGDGKLLPYSNPWMSIYFGHENNTFGAFAYNSSSEALSGINVTFWIEYTKVAL